jgi:hypothetical protein
MASKSGSTSEANAAATNTQSGSLPHSAMVCCHDTPQAEQNAAISRHKNSEFVNVQPLVSVGGLLDPVFIPYKSHQFYRTRPLYLSLSCFLI